MRRLAVVAFHLCLLVVCPVPGTAQPDDVSGSPADSEEQSERSSDRQGTDTLEPGPGGEATQTECRQHVNPENREDAERLTLLGVRCFRAGEFARAYTLYRRAYGVSKSPLLEAALGRSLHELGVYHAARSYYQTFLSSDSTSEAGTDKINARLDQLRDDINADGVSTSVSSFPPSATVHLKLPNGDWVELGQTPAELVVREGTWTVKVERKGHRTTTRELELTESNAPASVDVSLVRPGSEFDWSSRRWKRAGMFTGIASVPMLATAGLFFGLSRDNFAEASAYARTIDITDPRVAEPRSRGHSFRRAAIGFTAFGGAALMTGTLLWVRGKTLEPATTSSGESGSETASATPHVGPTGAAVRIRW